MWYSLFNEGVKLLFDGPLSLVKQNLRADGRKRYHVRYSAQQLKEQAMNTAENL